jgi:hypothetical protein
VVVRLGIEIEQLPDYVELVGQVDIVRTGLQAGSR